MPYFAEIDCFHHKGGDTPKAHLFSMTDRPQDGVFIPKSLVGSIDPRRVSGRHAGSGDAVSVEIQQWKVEEIGWEEYAKAR